MKGYAISGRYKQKDAYDIYYCIRNYPDGHEALARDCQPLMKFPTAVQGYRHIAAKFENVDSFGPTCVRRFVSATKILGVAPRSNGNKTLLGRSMLGSTALDHFDQKASLRISHYVKLE